MVPSRLPAGVVPDRRGRRKSGTLRAAAPAAALARGLRPQAMLDDNDAYGLFEAAESLVVTGPTRTNVNDFRARFVNDE
jgi:glycerate-2-kinase